ncbi:MAG: hypothetical protein V4608_15445 [Bacteroidota bacterium]
MKNKIGSKLNSKVVICLAGLAVVVCIAFAKHPVNENKMTATKNKVAPPLKGVNIDYKEFSVEAGIKTALKYETGSLITIPDNAFLDINGRPIVGKVDIKYREFHNPADFFVSGIPMTYDSAGIQYHFESAGMLEMLAFQNDKPVFVNPAKKIIVEMASQQADDKYNIYQYDSLKGNWKYAYKDHAIITKKSNMKESSEQLAAKAPSTDFNASQENSPVTSTDLLVPQKINRNSFQFDIAIDSAEFPEMSVYKGVLFEVDKKEKDFSPMYASTIWNDVSLDKGKQNGSYLMTLSKGEESHSFDAAPVFDEKNYENALTLYKKLFSKRKKNDKEKQRKSDSAYTVLNRERLDQIELVDRINQKAQASMGTQNLVQRVFVISGFGIWNSDCPAVLPKGEQFAANYTDTAGNKLTFKTLFLVEKGRNAMFSIASYSRLYYDPSKKNILWAVTSDNKLAVFEEENFKKIKIENDKCTIKMNVLNKPVTKAYEVRSLLKI